ncbi:MAG TPA: ABC transporter substrate-binding protein [Vicinamibacterales bacterium]|nr:ABC transporter substrate-binding protein [Vicinamibacterales bacterium]
MVQVARARTLAALGCAIAIASAAACGGSGGRADAPAPVVREQKPLPEEPRVDTSGEIGTYGGRFVLAQTTGPKTFNAMMANETSSTDVTGRLFVGLADFDNATQSDRPGLARSWEASADGLTWTFHLRKGAAFSDGHPITSADVMFSFALAYDDTLHPSVQDLLQTNGQRWQVSAPDDYTFVIRMAGPNAMVVPLSGAVSILPRHVLEAPFKAGSFASAYSISTPPEQIVTSGPWRLKQYVPGEKTVLEPNPYWFGVDARNNRVPYLDELVFLEVPDQDAADLKFRSGQIDGLENVKPENYQWYADNQRQGNFTLYDLGPALATNFFWFNLNTAQKAENGRKVGDPLVDPVKYRWFNNVTFRRAVSMAIDREAMIPSIFFGDAVKNWSTSTPGSKVWYTPDVVRYDFNLEESKRLLAGLGWKDGNGDGVLEDSAGQAVSFTMKTNSDNKMRVGMANFIRDDLAKVGIKVTLVPVDFNTLVTNIREDKQYDTILLGLQSGVPPEPAMGQNVWRSSGRTHYWNISQPKPATPEEARIDKLMDTLVANPDLPVRKQAWKEVQDIVNTQAWVVWLPTVNTKLPVSNRFGNATPSAIPHRLLWNIDRVFVKAR